MDGRSIYRRLAWHSFNATCSLLVITTGVTKGQSSSEVRQALRDIHDDRVPGNCVKASRFLFQHREALKEYLLDELYRTDKQGRDAILYVLFNTSSFVPDERFARLVITRLPEQDSQVRNYSVFELGPNSGDLEPIHTSGAHWEAWPFMNKYFATFEPLLKSQIGKTNNVFVLWGTAWLLKKRGVLQDYSALFTSAVLDSAVANLRDDTQNYNASHAVRLFLLLGDQSLPTLRKAASSKDQQTRYLAKAIIDALTKGSHDAFGYLNSKVKLTGVPFGEEPLEPSWLSEASAKYMDRDTYP